MTHLAPDDTLLQLNTAVVNFELCEDGTSHLKIKDLCKVRTRCGVRHGNGGNDSVIQTKLVEAWLLRDKDIWSKQTWL